MTSTAFDDQFLPHPDDAAQTPAKGADVALPPLPVAWGSAINDSGDGHIDLYSADQMRAYALAAQQGVGGAA